jgi:hypothetical protein
VRPCDEVTWSHATGVVLRLHVLTQAPRPPSQRIAAASRRCHPSRRERTFVLLNACWSVHCAPNRALVLIDTHRSSSRSLFLAVQRIASLPNDSLALIVRLIPSFFSTEQRSPRIAVRSNSSLELHRTLRTRPHPCSHWHSSFVFSELYL